MTKPDFHPNNYNYAEAHMFKEDAIVEAGLHNHSKAEKAYELAWNYGHSSGYNDVWAYLQDLAELLLED
jgi:hypothetical protein